MNTSNAINTKVYVPNLITKELSIVQSGDARKVRLSSNFLRPMGFEPGVRHSVTPLAGCGGIRVAFDDNGPQKIYSRQYPSRRNNPHEAVLEIASQKLLNEGLPGWTERLHFQLRPGEIIITPLVNRTFAIRRQLANESNPFETFVAMTSGVDIRCLMDSGFTINSVLEYRPQESRDKRDLTETGMLTVLANSAPKNAFCENINTIDWARVASAMEGGPQIAVVHACPSCDDFSRAKANSLKERSLNDLTTSADQVYDVLRLVETVGPAVVILEQVPDFMTSPEGNLLRTKLRRWGYHVEQAVLSANEYGGKTGRTRTYLVASVFPGFEMPRPIGVRSTPLWADIEPFLADCRDISHTKSLHDGLECGRARVLSMDSIHSPTILKSQARQAKDSLFILTPDGRYLYPSLELMKYLNGIPMDFDLNSVSMEQATEQIGQSIDEPMHAAVCQAVHAHIAANVGRHTAVNITNRQPDAPLAPVKAATNQMNLFNV